MAAGWGTPKMATNPPVPNEVRFSDPYKRCVVCKGWVDGANVGPGPLTVIPCSHVGDYEDVCPSWGPVDGCSCLSGTHDMRPPADDGKVY